MKVVIEGKNIELTRALKDYVNEKLHRLQNHYENIIKGHEVRVKLSVAKNPRISNNNTTEVTIFLDGKIIRSEQASEDMYASIDMVVDKLDRQIQKYKAKSYRSYKHKSRVTAVVELEPLILPSELENNYKGLREKRTIKSKKIRLQLLTPEEALVQMELTEHEFYTFINSKTKQINVIYKRKPGDFGLIEPIL